VSRRDKDIKAPDGYLLGGLRKVHRDGTILFHRMWWRCPADWVGEKVWVHVTDGMLLNVLDAAPPGQQIFEALSKRTAIKIEPVNRPDAKPLFRHPSHSRSPR